MDFYDLLGVAPDAPQEDVQRAFRRRVREYHPDRNDDPRAPAQFIALKKAYDTLGDPKERDAYDRLGHETYVSERISGLPSVETWATAEDGDAVPSDDPGEVAAGGPDTDAASDWTPDAGPDADGRGAESEVDPEFEFDFEFDFDATVDGVASETGESAGTTVGPDQGPSMDGFVIDADGAPSDLAGAGDAGGAVRSVEVSKSPTASGAGTARGPKTAPETEPESEAPSPEPSIPEEYVEDDDEAGPTLAERLRDRGRWLFGWPLVGLADIVYLGALVAVYAANADAVASLAAAVRVSGPTAALDAGYGITGPAALVSGAVSGSVSPLVGGTVLLGLALLPSVYCLLVWWTRRHSQWDPSYLYAAGAVVPVAWTAASAVADGGLAADLLAYVVVPVATMGAMVFFRILLPRGVRLVRQYRYRLLN